MSRAKNIDSTTPSGTPAGSAASAPLNEIGRRELPRGGGVAALAAGVTVVGAAGPVLAEHGERGGDMELRRLWGEYLERLQAMRAAQLVYRPARKPYDAEFDSLKKNPEYETAFGELHRALWKKHGLEPLARRVTVEHRKLIRITKAIRKAKAETMFGVGVKLSVSEHFEEWDVVEAAEDARRALVDLTGFNFVAATGPLVAEA